MKDEATDSKQVVGRRSFMKKSLVTAGTATAAAGLLTSGLPLFASDNAEEHRGTLTKGDAALLRFAAAAEILETDFWVQYNELAGVNWSVRPIASPNRRVFTSNELPRSSLKIVEAIPLRRPW